MTELLTSAQMRNLEQAAISSGSVTGLELMERAGRGVVEAVFDEWPALTTGAHRAVVLCGPGNNGGDGFVVARLLGDAGWHVTVHALGWDMIWSPNAVRPDAPPDARANADRWRAMGGRTAALDQFDCAALCEDGHIVVIDALLGIGQTRTADNMLNSWWLAWDDMCNLSPDNDIHLVSVDVPTGYNSDTGAALAANPFEPDLSVTFHAAKPVHSTLSDRGGRTVVADIGLPGRIKCPPEA